jgi:DNA-binding Lrp family transcriptional regulator
MDAQLASYATVRQLEYLEATEKHGSQRAAAKALGVDESTIRRSLDKLKAAAAIKGYSPEHEMTRTVPDGFKVQGVSSLYVDGKLSSQWVKATVDQERQAELMKAAMEALAEDVRGLAPIAPAPDSVSADLLTVIPMGDPHFGMYSWAREAGDDFDTEKARALTLGAVDRLLSVTPPSDTCVILPLGDVFHANDQTNQTPAHKHQLDVDSRFVRVLQVGIQAYRQAILRALERHKRVIVKFVAGNHDPQAVWALAFSIAAYFDNEPRVTVDLEPSKFWFLHFGKVLIGATHGDTVKPEALEGVMAADKPQEWGQSKHRYWYTGHIHSSNKKEFRGCVWESFRTLAARDAYAAGHGYRAGRDMLAIIHHREHGEIERHRCDVGML